MSRDVDELLLLWGDAAIARASDLSWREDSGLMSSPRAGHWSTVRSELARRLGHSEPESAAEFAA